MKFLIVSPAGDSAGIACRLLDEGNEVAMLILDDAGAERGKGIVPKVHDWSFELDKDVIYLFDCTGVGVLADSLREAGYSVVGGSLLADRLEMDRNFSSQVMRDCGIKTPQSRTFGDWDEAKEFVSEHEGKLVFKPSSGLSGNIPSYVSSSPKEMLQMLDYYHGIIHGEPEFELQEFVEGVDVSSEGWFDGREFVPPFNHTLECKHLMEGDSGPSGGCTGNVVWICDGCEVCHGTVAKVERYLREHDYGVGPVDINAVVSDEGIHGLEFTPRFGYDASPTLFYGLLEGGVGQFLGSFHGLRESDVKFRPGYAAGVRITIPPWPSEKHEAPAGLPILGLSRNDWKNFCPYDVMLNEHDDIVTCGAWGIIGVAVGYGGSIASSFEEAYRIADKVEVPNKQRRSDLAEVFEKKHRRVGRILAEA